MTMTGRDVVLTMEKIERGLSRKQRKLAVDLIFELGKMILQQRQI